MSRAPNLRFPVVFYEEDPELWFFQLEQTFIMNKVSTQRDMYAVVISYLPCKVCRRIPRTISSEKQPYDVLKKFVVKETDLTDYQWSKKLHPLPSLGDQRPLELLASIRNLQPVHDCKCY